MVFPSATELLLSACSLGGQLPFILAATSDLRQARSVLLKTLLLEIDFIC